MTPAEKDKIWWSQEAAFEFVRRKDLAHAAAKEGWIGPMVGFAREKHRMPDTGSEINFCKRMQRDFEGSLAMTAGTDFVSRWRSLGEAIARQQTAWTTAILNPLNHAPLEGEKVMEVER